MSTLIVLGIGMLIGWCVPQPAWVYNAEVAIWTKIKSWASSNPVPPT